VSDTPETPGDAAELRAENARLQEVVERFRLLNEDKDGVIADLRARNQELEERVARLERLISRNSGNSSMPPSSDDLPGKKPPERKPPREAEAGQAARRAGRVPGVERRPGHDGPALPAGSLRVRERPRGGPRPGRAVFPPGH